MKRNDAADSLRFFAPSALRLPPEALGTFGSAAGLVARAAMRRVWNVGAASYQPIAVAVPLPDGTQADLLVRRRYTLEVCAVAVDGSPAAALARALAGLEALRAAPPARAALLAAYRRRAEPAGLPPARDVFQALVLAPVELYARPNGDLAPVWSARERLASSPLGFRFLACIGGTDETIGPAPPPFGDELSLVRDVAALSKH